MSKKQNNNVVEKVNKVVEMDQFIFEGTSYNGVEVAKCAKDDSKLSIQRLTHTRMIHFEKLRTEEELKKNQKKLSDTQEQIVKEEEKINALSSQLKEGEELDESIYSNLNTLKANKEIYEKKVEEGNQKLDDLEELKGGIGEHADYMTLTDNEKRVVDVIARSLVEGALKTMDFGINASALEAMYKRCIRLADSAKVREVQKKDGSTTIQSDIDEWYKTEFKQLKYDLTQLMKEYFSTQSDSPSNCFKSFSCGVSVALVERLISVCGAKIENKKTLNKKIGVKIYENKKVSHISFQTFKIALGMLISAKLEGCNIEDKLPRGDVQ